MKQNASSASEATRLQRLTGHLPDAIFIMDLKTNRPVFFNHESFLGFPIEQLMSPGSILVNLHPQDAARVQEHWGKVMRGMPEPEIEYRVKNSQGEWEWIASREVLLEGDHNGKPGELMVILTIITERVKAQQQTAYLAAMLQNVNDAIVCTDEDFRIVYWNPAAERLFGWKAEEAIGQITSEVLHTRMTPAERATSERSLRKAGWWKGEVTQYTRAGRPLLFEANVMRMQDAWGQTIYVAANREISRRRLAEKAAKAANRKLRKALKREQLLARTDPLTGVFNRRHFFELAEQAFMEARRYGSPLSLLILDIDHFKRVNDSFGHQLGDQMLQRVAQLMKESIRKADILARYGGEEFILLLPQTEMLAAEALAERIRRRVEGFRLPRGSEGISVTLSIGLAGMLPGLESLDRLVAHADAAMYQAKLAGRNRTASHAE